MKKSYFKLHTSVYYGLQLKNFFKVFLQFSRSFGIAVCPVFLAVNLGALCVGLTLQSTSFFETQSWKKGIPSKAFCLSRMAASSACG
jgi:hypothetical protein